MNRLCCYQFSFLKRRREYVNKCILKSLWAMFLCSLGWLFWPWNPLLAQLWKQLKCKSGIASFANTHPCASQNAQEQTVICKRSSQFFCWTWYVRVRDYRATHLYIIGQQFPLLLTVSFYKIFRIALFGMSHILWFINVASFNITWKLG